MAPSSPNYHTTLMGRRLKFNRFNVHPSPTRRIFTDTGLELVTRQPRSDTLTTRLPRPTSGHQKRVLTMVEPATLVAEDQRRTNHTTQAA
ncbi:hypothetical protein TNCV_1401571 [Trichonephila clavipes]|nr:hypothetical protein TNCV_1401571 [Trichonephila clavipes]